MDWTKKNMGKWKHRPGLKKYTGITQRIREISVEAETLERATRLLQRRLDKNEKVISIQINLI